MEWVETKWPKVNKNMEKPDVEISAKKNQPLSNVVGKMDGQGENPNEMDW